MIVILLWNEHKIQISVNPEIIVDRFLLEEAEEFFGFAWVLAQQAKQKGKDPELDMEERRQAGVWEKTVKNEVGVTYDIKAAMGMPDGELAKYTKLPDEDMRVYTHIVKNKEDLVLDGGRTLLSYSIMGKPTIRVTFGKRPPIIKIVKKDETTFVATDEVTGKEHTVNVEEGHSLSVGELKDMFRKSLTGAADLIHIQFALPSGASLGVGDDAVALKDAEHQLEHKSDAGSDAGSEDSHKAEPTQRKQSSVKPKVSCTAVDLGQRASKVAAAAAWADKPTVFQIGSYHCKAGHAGEKVPKVCEPSIRGQLKDSLKSALAIGSDKFKDDPVCSAVWDSKMYTGLYCLVADTPDWSSLERIWSYAFYTKMAHRPEFSPVMVTLPILASDHFKQNLVTSLLEHLGFCGCYFVVSSVTPLRGMGIETGLVVDLGFNNTFAVPVVNRTYMPGMVQRLMSHENREERVGGLHMIEKVISLMRAQGFEGVGENKDARKMREAVKIFESHCFVALDPEMESITNDTLRREVRVERGDGTFSTFVFEEDRWSIPEALFKAKTAGKKMSTGLDGVICDAIKSCDVDLRAEMYANVVLAGGLAKLQGLQARLERELLGRLPTAAWKIHEVANHGHFRGASCMADELKMEAWISPEEFEQTGPTIYRLKCLDL